MSVPPVRNLKALLLKGVRQGLGVLYNLALVSFKLRFNASPRQTALAAITCSKGPPWVPGKMVLLKLNFSAACGRSDSKETTAVETEAAGEATKAAEEETTEAAADESGEESEGESSEAAEDQSGKAAEGGSEEAAKDAEDAGSTEAADEAVAKAESEEAAEEEAEAK